MAKYAARFSRTLSTATNNSIGSHGASSTTQERRHKLLFLSFGCSSTPADQALELTAVRYAGGVGGGTSSPVTPKPLDKADSTAFLGVAGENHSVDPAYTAGETLLAFSVHQRDRIVYYAPPGAEIVVPATNLSGIGYQTDLISSGTPVASMTVHLEE